MTQFQSELLLVVTRQGTLLSIKAGQRHHQLFHPRLLLYGEGRNQCYVPGSKKDTGEQQL